MDRIETKRTYLRRWEEKDLDIMNRIFGSDEIMSPVGNGGPLSTTRVESLFKFFMQHYQTYNFGPMAVVLSESQQVIGINGIKQQTDVECPDLGFAFLKEYWGHGYAEETSQAILKNAFETLEIKNIFGLVHPANAPSINLLKKLGFVFKHSMIKKTYPTDVYEISNFSSQ